MNFLKTIEAKRDGQPLTNEQIRQAVTDYANGAIPDYQMSAFLMTVFFRGLSYEETRSLTLAMRDSGDTLEFPEEDRPIVDHTSTGGVGDKVPLLLAPLLASLGFRVPSISGRSLGIAGGPLDKLESIPGFLTALTGERIVEIVQNVGCCMAGQTAFMAPADMRIYALRDVTGTIPSIPLITSSILSRKLAESVSALLVEVDFGRAGFMSDLESARELARNLVTVARESGVNARALLTHTDTPIGRTVGNWLEIREVVDSLEGKGPDDVRELALHAAACLLEQTGRCSDLSSGLKLAEAELASGRPRRKWDELLQAQGVHLEVFREKLASKRTAPVVRECVASEPGFVTQCDALVIGELVRELGGGRFRKEDIVDYEVGVDMLAKPGEAVSAGQVVGRVHALSRDQAEEALARLKTAIVIGPEKPAESKPLIGETVA